MGRTGRGSVIGNDREAALGKTAGQWKDTHPQSGMNAGYLDTVRLLLDVTPEVFSVENFAMKGGTALNFFTENMPRLSVDIDVVLELLNIDPVETKEKLQRDMFTLNDALFNEVLRGLYQRAGEALSEGSNATEIIAKNMKLDYKKKEEPGRF